MGTRHGTRHVLLPPANPPTSTLAHPQKLLLGYEFPETIMLLAGKTLLVHTTGKKCA